MNYVTTVACTAITTSNMKINNSFTKTYNKLLFTYFIAKYVFT